MTSSSTLHSERPSQSLRRHGAFKIPWQVIRSGLFAHPLVYVNLNVVALIAMSIFLVCDPLAETTVLYLTRLTGVNELVVAMKPAAMADYGYRLTFATWTSLLVVFTGAGLLLSLLIGPASSRSIRGSLVAVTLASCWLAAFSNWSGMVWHGKQWRARSTVDDLERIAERLHADWPHTDGTDATFGPFMAYPEGAPSTLLLLGPPTLENQRNSFCAVERSSAGGLRFQLTHQEAGQWMEWHPAGQRPSSFVSGLSEHYQLSHSVSLRRGWFLTRYSLHMSRSTDRID